MPARALSPGDVDTWRTTLAERAKYRSVVAKWQDEGGAELVPEQVGEGDPVYSIRHAYRDADQARRAAKAKLKAFQRGVGTLDIAMPGRPEAGAERQLSLTGFRPGVDGAWAITRAEHRIENGGYTCSVSAEVPKTTQSGFCLPLAASPPSSAGRGFPMTLHPMKARQVPRGIRNCSPGNIRLGNPWQGLAPVQSDPQFCQFLAPKWGIRALARLLIAYQDRHGLRPSGASFRVSRQVRKTIQHPISSP